MKMKEGGFFEFFIVMFLALTVASLADTTFVPFKLATNDTVYYTLMGAYFIYDMVLRKKK